MRNAALLLFTLLIVLGCGKRADPPADESPVKAGPPEGKKPGGAPPAPKAAEPHPKAEKPAGLNEWVRLDAVRVRLTGVKVQRVPLDTPDGKSLSAEPELMVWVQTENVSPTATVSYGRWDRPGYEGASELKDDRGTVYRLRGYDGFIGPRAEGALGVSTQPLNPGDPAVADVICFERPAAGAAQLTLTLMSPQPGGRRFRFAIPAAAWGGG